MEYKIQAKNFKLGARPPKMSKTALNLPDDLTTAYRPQKNSLNRISKESQKFDFWTHLVDPQKQWVNLGVQKSVFLGNIEVQ